MKFYNYFRGRPNAGQKPPYPPLPLHSSMSTACKEDWLDIIIDLGIEIKIPPVVISTTVAVIVNSIIFNSSYSDTNYSNAIYLYINLHTFTWKVRGNDVLFYIQTKYKYIIY